MNFDDRLLQSLLGRAMSGEVWLAVAYIAAMFVVLAFRPQQVGSPALLRLSNVLFGLYLLVPSLAEAILVLIAFDTPTGGPFRGDPSRGLVLITQMSAVAGKVLYALSVVLGLVSLRTQVGLINPRDLPDWPSRPPRTEQD